MRACICFIFVLACLGRWKTEDESYQENLPAKERVFVASKIYSLLQSGFFCAKIATSQELDQPYKNYLRKVLDTDDRRKFDLATIEFVAQLHSGHTFFWDTWLNESNGRPIGFYALPFDGKWAIQSSALEDLKPGDVISKIDDTAIEPFFLQRQRYISASSRAAQRRNLFLLPYLFPERFTLTLDDGKQIAVDRLKVSKPPQKVEGRWLNPDRIAYVRIPSFLDPMFEGFALNYVRQFRHAGVLIVDVRNNSGGIPPKQLIRAVMDRPYRGWLQITRSADPTCTQNRPEIGQEPSADSQDVPTLTRLAQSNKPIAPSQNAFHGRLILLVDGGCVSACEDFVEPSKDSGRAIIVGDTTQGSAGVPLFYDFHNGMTLRIADKRSYLPDGSEFEGVGIKPDVEVHTTIDDLKNGRDPVLEKALEIANKP